MSASPCARRWIVVGLSLAALGWATLGSERVAQAQTAQMTAGVKPDGAPVDVSKLVADPKLANQLRQIVYPILLQGKPDGQQQADNVDMWVVYRIAQLTLPPTDARDTVEQRRSNIKTRELLKLSGAAQDQTLHDRINAMMLANLPPLIGKADYSIEARYNAMLLLGMLDRVEPDSTQNRDAVPLDASQPLLIAAANSEALPEVLRVGALVGLARQCNLQLGAANRPAIAGEALKLLQAKEPPKGLSANGFHWARKQAIDMVIGLAKFAEVNRPEFVQALNAILADAKQPLFLRRDAALAFGYLEPSVLNSGNVKAAEICKSMANYTLEVMKAGSPRPDPSAPIDLAKAEDVFPTPNEDNKQQFAQAVAYYLNCAATGLGGRNTNRGLSKAINAADPAFANVNTLLNTHINPMIGVLTSPRINSTSIVQDLNSKLGPLNDFVNQMGGGAPAAPVTSGSGPPVGATTTLAAPVTP